MSKLGEERRHPRREVEYPAEIWICRDQGGRRIFADCGIRGILKNVSSSGVGIREIRSFNVRGWKWGFFLSPQLMLKILVHTSKGPTELWGSIVWIQQEDKNGCVGIRVVSTSEENPSFLLRS